jgi:hypothetical protein
MEPKDEEPSTPGSAADATRKDTQVVRRGRGARDPGPIRTHATVVEEEDQAAEVMQALRQYAARAAWARKELGEEVADPREAAHLVDRIEATLTMPPALPLEPVREEGPADPLPHHQR